jgi:hypothetical protein
MARLMTTDHGLGLLEADRERVALLDLGDGDIGAALERGITLEKIAKARARERVQLSDVRILPPVLWPCYGGASGPSLVQLTTAAAPTA